MWRLLVICAVFSNVYCGNNGRVIGGYEAPLGIAPFQVSFQYVLGSPHFCGGAIIDEQWIVTAAHCVLTANRDYIKVITGTNDFKRPGRVYWVDKIYTHGNYNNPRYHNDIAVVRLNETIEMNEFTQIIEMASEEELAAGDDLTITGWGSILAGGHLYPEKLQMLDTKFVPIAECAEAHVGTDGTIDAGNICTFTARNEGTCFGDSGSPVVHNGKLHGLVSWGEPCAVGIPDVHTNVPYFYDYIRSVIRGCDW